jgi:hypothetical protein
MELSPTIKDASFVWCTRSQPGYRLELPGGAGKLLVPRATLGEPKLVGLSMRIKNLPPSVPPSP